MELSSELRQRCKEAFEACKEFDSNDQLRDFMAVAPFKPFRGDVEANTKPERIDRCIARLPEKTWKTQEVFLSFVDELCKQYQEGDSRRQTLDTLYSDLKSSIDQSAIVLPDTTRASLSSVPMPQNMQQKGAGEDDKSKRVLAICSQNEAARIEISEFLKGARLVPVEWKQIEIDIRKSGPSVDEVLSTAFNSVQAVMVVFTGDDLVEPERVFAHKYNAGDTKEPEYQPEPDLLFKAGAAFGMHPTRTILVALGDVRNFHSLLERHLVRLNGSDETRKEVIAKLERAGCTVIGYEWTVKGNFQNVAFKRT